MIYPRRNFFIRTFFSRYIDHILKKNFDHFYAANPEPDWKSMCSHAVLVLPNHFSWWDGFFVDYVNRYHLGKKGHVMISEFQLKKYSFFRGLGGYSINIFSRKEIEESLDYTARLMQIKENMSLVFPQGKIQNADETIQLKYDAIEYCVNNTEKDFYLFPVFFHIAYHHNPRPDLWVYYGNPILSRDYHRETFEQVFLSSMAELKVLAAKRRIHKRYF